MAVQSWSRWPSTNLLKESLKYALDKNPLKCLFHHRKGKAKEAAFANLALYAHKTVEFLHDAFHNRKPETVAFCMICS